MTTIAPSAMMIVLLALLSFNASLVLRAQWMKIAAFGLGVYELALVLALLLTA